MKRYALALALLLPCFAAVPEIDKAKAMGSPTAPVTMEVFASFDCPHCKDLHDNTLPLIIRDYVVPGKVYLVNREFPLAGQYHPFAREAADYAVAAARIGKYQQVADALFRNQQRWAVEREGVGHRRAASSRRRSRRRCRRSRRTPASSPRCSANTMKASRPASTPLRPSS